MKLIIAYILTSITVFAGLESPFASSVDGLTINNSHYLNEDKSVIRGQAPNGKFEELIEFGITDILIFKNQTRDEIDREIDQISSTNINYKQIDFVWRDINDFENACHQVINAIDYIKQVEVSRGKIFFHCTVGEDRTGVLSGIYELLKNPSKNKYEIFNEDMCERGYAEGNPHKPKYVTGKIHQSLSPLFFAMVDYIQSHGIDYHNISKEKSNLCGNLKMKKFIKRNYYCK
ncbi:tyrosine-protein phosphatase [Bacteriovoracaceae bacterium]|nr:tyrosine-protein phosphatase [Bacteriovoracaceae bacterium]